MANSAIPGLNKMSDKELEELKGDETAVRCFLDGLEDESGHRAETDKVAADAREAVEKLLAENAELQGQLEKKREGLLNLAHEFGAKKSDVARLREECCTSAASGPGSMAALAQRLKV